MSEKHLTELPWKTLVVKQGVKDLGLQKSLVAYVKLDATKEPAKTLETLKEISELALKLKKTYAAKSDVVEHLDEMVKEVKKISPPLEAKVKPAEKSADKSPAKEEEEAGEDEGEEEAAAFKKDLKNQMVSALAQVKMRAPGDPKQDKEPKPQLKFMAYLAGKVSAVIVAKKVGSATKKLLPDIAGGATGGKFVLGECIFEKNAHTFVLDAVPGGLAQKLATALNAETGVKYKVRVRSTDGSVILDSDTDVDPEAATVGGDPAAEWKAKLAEWTPAIKEALAAKGPNAAAMAKLYAQATALSKPGGDMVQALAKLTECHALATAGEPTGNPSDLFNERFKVLLPDIKAAAGTPIGDEAKLKASEASVFARKKDFAQANQLLDQVETLLRRPTPGQALADEDAETPAELWEAAKAAAVSKLQEVVKLVVASKDPDVGKAELELKAVMKQLNAEVKTQTQVAEMERYLKEDDVVADVSELVSDLKTPLLRVLAEITPQLADR